ncbi:DUF1800 domain-containing protein [Hyalangium sp.]|uniref:DUF1800 domain-containing protein n=1 Tax=Hyalangium sp. TaxID=2028555 RepID=UPI002D3141BD|nr:DUF1800 domain-containing protein [Hyalangium sp.]HYH95727.1 DUF1800 domain-containing protein [Hyalangium sp.]
MDVTPHRTALWCVVALVAVGCTSTSKTPSPSAAPTVATLVLPDTGWSEDQRALHALRRLAYGPSPQDWAEVRRSGVAHWMALQLHPQHLPDDAVAARLEPLSTLRLSTEELMTRYPPLRQQARELGFPLESPEDRRELAMMLGTDALPRRVSADLMAQKLIRAVESRHQLQEVLVDFWFNHFNVSAEKGPVRWMVTSYERDAIRPHVFGRFRDLLGATARHPAMLFYLDNWTSVRDGFEPLRRGRLPPAFRKNARGLNENYARELLELHTLGVDGGYTQEDVREVARVFTGWSLNRPRLAPAFVFRADAHDPDEKRVLGSPIASGGEKEGEQVLDMLARHPSTARFLATKLARKFVSDEPPATLVDRLAQVFLDSDGELRAVYAALFTSPEFWSDAAWSAKTKTPLELVASSLRALGGTTDGGPPLARAVERMGEPLYRAPAPTGYPEHATPWVNAGALVSRLNFALALAADRVRGTEVDVKTLLPRPWPEDTGTLVDTLALRLLYEPLSPQTRATLLAALEPGEDGRMPDGEVRPVDLRRAAGLLLGSPEFQKQ